MEQRVIGFIPPVIGVDDEFNTFRLGAFYAKNLKPGEEVFLLNEKIKMVFGRAVVERIEEGPLGEMCLIHGSKNHTQLKTDANTAGEKLFAIMRKIHGPHIATPTRKTSVVYLKRIE